MTRIFCFWAVFFLIVFGEIAFAGEYTFEVRIKNQPDNPVVIGYVRGDKFISIDSLKANVISGFPVIKSIKYSFSDNFDRGMYRIIFGQTTYSRVMGEPPQQLDFIFNREDILFETDFKDPQDSLVILSSDENRLWFNFLQQEKQYHDRLKELEQEVDYYDGKITSPGNSGDPVPTYAELESLKDKRARKANEFNQLQMERDMFINQLSDKHNELFASSLINNFREPFRDGYLSSIERSKFYQKDCLNFVDFADESLVNSSVLTEKVFNYLVTFNREGFTKEQREKTYMKAVDEIMGRVKNASATTSSGDSNDEYGIMYEFILSYLVNGFELLRMDNVLAFINDNYADGLCRTDDKTTLERRLNYQSMKVGTTVPDFTLDDIKGKRVTLSKVMKEKTLILFWASWCNHCNEILPQIRTWHEKKKPDNFQIIAISLDTSLTEWHKAVVKAGFESYYNLSDLKEWNGDVAKVYNVYATPTMFLIDGNRRIISKPVTFFDLTESLNF